VVVSHMCRGEAWKASILLRGRLTSFGGLLRLRYWVVLPWHDGLEPAGGCVVADLCRGL